MKSKKTYAVFGLGRYGIAVARELVETAAPSTTSSAMPPSLSLAP